MNQFLNNSNSIVAVSDHSIVLVRGIGAVKFLQGQVTCDINALLSADNQRSSAFGAHCTHKGRMLFTFRAFCVDDSTIALIVYRALIPQVMQTLGKYIVFSKAELIDAHEDYQLLGVQGEKATAVLKQYIPHISNRLNTVSLSGSIIAICLGEQRYEIVLSKKLSKRLSKRLSNKEMPNETACCRDSLYAVCQSRGIDFWTLANIQSGIGEVRPETVEEFIPQMLNLQRVSDGISFNKGCYTGQEIVARMKYLGTLKRQMYRFRLETEVLPNPGDSVYSLSGKPVGTVVIASHEGDSVEVLAVVVNSVIEKDTVYLDKHQQSQLQLLSLPYDINEET